MIFECYVYNVKVVQFSCNVFGFVSSEWLRKDKDWTGSEIKKYVFIFLWYLWGVLCFVLKHQGEQCLCIIKNETGKVFLYRNTLSEVLGCSLT